LVWISRFFKKEEVDRYWIFCFGFSKDVGSGFFLSYWIWLFGIGFVNDCLPINFQFKNN